MCDCESLIVVEGTESPKTRRRRSATVLWGERETERVTERAERERWTAMQAGDRGVDLGRGSISLVSVSMPTELTITAALDSSL